MSQYCSECSSGTFYNFKILLTRYISMYERQNFRHFISSCEISGSYGSKYEDVGLPGYSAV
jgi:hypothetical protein